MRRAWFPADAAREPPAVEGVPVRGHPAVTVVALELAGATRRWCRPWRGRTPRERHARRAAIQRLL